VLAPFVATANGAPDDAAAEPLPKPIVQPPVVDAVRTLLPSVVAVNAAPYASFNV